MSIAQLFTSASNAVARGAGPPLTFAACCLIIIVWAATGPLVGYSDTWQLIINTGTTIVTFLMVFLIQSTQNRDGGAIQAKLDELIRASGAQNAFIGVSNI
jgi:low affinity Fe/Cu permease